MVWSMRKSTSINCVNLALFGFICVLLHFGAEADGSSSCSYPGLPGRDGSPGQAGRDGRDGLSGAVGSPGAPGAEGLKGDTGNKGEAGSPGLTGPQGVSGSTGITYVRWGRTVCPSVTGTELVYAGLTAGSHFEHSGGGANYICTATGGDVEYHAEASTSNANQATLYGTEYEIPGGRPLDQLNNHNVPCAVCDASTRSRQIMIPGRYTCPDTWTVEYSGWLMAESNPHFRTMYICLDKAAETVNGAAADTNGAVMYHVEANCDTGLPCPNYDTTKELACVVCTK